MEIQEQLEGLPGYDIIQGLWDEYAGKKFQTKDPFEDENGNKRRLPSVCTKQEQKIFKSIQSKAWQHDRCFLGGCGVGLDCGIGLVPIVVLLLPFIGPIIMYVVHQRLIRVASQKFAIPAKLDAKLNANIAFDMLITFPPLLGCFFGWMNRCSTRNAALLYDYMVFVGEQRSKSRWKPVTTGVINQEPIFGDHINREIENNLIQNKHIDQRIPIKKPFKKSKNEIIVDSKQQLGFV